MLTFTCTFYMCMFCCVLTGMAIVVQLGESILVVYLAVLFSFFVIFAFYTHFYLPNMEL